MDDACVVDRPERLSESTCETDDRVEAEGSAVGYCFCQGRAIDVLSDEVRRGAIQLGIYEACGVRAGYGSPCLDFPTETYAEFLVVGKFESDQLECPEALSGLHEVHDAHAASTETAEDAVGTDPVGISCAEVADRHFLDLLKEVSVPGCSAHRGSTVAVSTS
jgi:hypothetical protein